MDICYGLANQPGDLEQILQLQTDNLTANISAEELEKEGFVTAVHDWELLREMNNPHPHIVARIGSQIIGYTLVMLPEMSDRLPILFSMFEKLRQLSFQKRLLSDQTWFVMGQVCIAKAYRGQGVFTGLYQELKQQMAPRFDCIITEISARNPRSLRAHQKVGFQEFHRYHDQEEWVLVGWDWQ
ncbi:MAG: GNAT family N-acetyltransferase [Bacteroidota bacterium]